MFQEKMFNKIKVIVMIPAFNEEKLLSSVIQDIPKEIEGIDKIEILVINDGSTDRTLEIAEKSGANYIISNNSNQGLAMTFKKGIEESLRRGADIIVNTDADFQYNQKEIPKLIKPILEKKAEMVIGNRQVRTLKHMKFGNKYGNIIGSFLMRVLLKNRVTDASSGFRAFSRQCALRLNILSDHTYTHETIIQCTLQKMRIIEVPVEFRKREEGESKLVRNIWSHLKHSGAAIVRVYLMYRPLKTFLSIGIIIFFIGLFFEGRYLWFYFHGQNGGHIQSLLLGTTLIIVGFQIATMGFLADLIDANRRINDEILYKMKKKECEKK